MAELGVVMTIGGAYYGDRNWEKGMRVSRYMTSLLRHAYGYIAGDPEPYHMGKVMFNAQGIIHTVEMIKRGHYDPKLFDLPDYKPKEGDNVLWYPKP